MYGTAPDGSKVGAWWVVNQKDTFFGGPVRHSLLSHAYCLILSLSCTWTLWLMVLFTTSNLLGALASLLLLPTTYLIRRRHGGATSPIIQNGFDRTFGPQFLYFNGGAGAKLQTLLHDAQSLADATWNTAFYDEIAPHVRCMPSS